MVAATDTADILVSHMNDAADDGATGHGPTSAFSQVLYRAHGGLSQMAAFSRRLANFTIGIGIPHPNLRETLQVNTPFLLKDKNIDDFSVIIGWHFVKNKFSVWG